MKKITFTFLFLFFLTALITAQNQRININQAGQNLTPEISLVQKSEQNAFNNALRAREINFNTQLKNLINLQTGTEVLIQLFADKSYLSVIEKISKDINGITTIRTKLTDFKYAYCIITITNNTTSLTLDIPELKEKYITKINPTSNSTYILQLDQNNLDFIEGGQPLTKNKLPENNSDNNSTNSINNEQSINFQKESFNNSDNSVKASVNDPAIINVMVVYTTAAKNWANSNEGSINNTIADAMAKANLASQNSDLGITYNLVYSGEVSYVEVDPNTDLDALSTNGDGIMDDVHTNRNTYSADMVVLFCLTDATGGLGYLLNDKYGSEDVAFCLNRVQQVSWTYTMIHEMGHNMGAHHHKLQNFQAGPTTWNNWAENTWSAGWRWTGSDNGKYCDIMTYEDGSYFADGIDHTRIPFFSSPDFTYMGQPVGDAVDGDNARTLKEVKHYVAQYRDANTLLYCAAGTNNYGYTSLTNVTIGSINQTSSYSTYTDFSFNTTDVTPGIDHQLTITKSSTSSYEVIVWVDWNNDKDFIDNGEEVYKSGSLSPVTFITNINPPLGTSAGNKRMRIRIHNTTNGPNITPCGNADRGEVEDYTLNVLSSATYNVTFNVTDGTSPISGANVTFNSTSQLTNALGTTVFANISPGNGLAYSVTKTNYTTINSTVNVVNQDITENVVMTSSIPTTKLYNNYCGYSTGNLTSTIYCEQVSGAQDYEYKFEHSATGYSQIKQRGSSLNYLTLSSVPGISYGKTYDVSVKAKVGGVWGNYGTICQVTVLSGQFTTKLYNSYCGYTTGNLTSSIYCDVVSGAEDYEYKFEHLATGYSQTKQKGSSINYLTLSTVPGISYGKTYDVSVRAKVGGVWGNYGTICQVTVLSGQFTTKLYKQYCGFVTNTLSSYIYCDAVAGVQDYEYQFEDNASPGTYIYFQRSSVAGGNINNMRLSWAGLTTGKTYNVAIRAKVGGVWGNFGTICTVTITSTKSSEIEPIIIVNAIAYPNPFNSTSTILLEGNSQESFNVYVYDITGKILSNHEIYCNQEFQIGKELTNGIYFVVISGNEFKQTLKLVKTE